MSSGIGGGVVVEVVEMATDEYREQLRERYQEAFLRGLGASPEREWPSIPLREEERIALMTLRLLVERGVIRP